MTRVMRFSFDSTTASIASSMFGDSFGSLPSERPVGAPPTVVPGSQSYFWTSKWQEGERAADRDIAAGEVLSFDDPTDAIRWLLG